MPGLHKQDEGRVVRTTGTAGLPGHGEGTVHPQILRAAII